MREILSRKDLVESLYDLDFDYYVNIDDAVKSLYVARTIIRKYIKTNDIKDKMLLNNIIITNNIFGIKLSNYAFYHTFTDEEYKFVKSVLIFLNIYDNTFGFDVEEDEPLLNLFHDTLSRYKVQHQ